jgi:hypothetical protein
MGFYIAKFSLLMQRAYVSLCLNIDFVKTYNLVGKFVNRPFDLTL